jgi:hypothetical protein
MLALNPKEYPINRPGPNRVFEKCEKLEMPRWVWVCVVVAEITARGFLDFRDYHRPAVSRKKAVSFHFLLHMKATSLNPRRSPSQQVSFMMTVKV